MKDVAIKYCPLSYGANRQGIDFGFDVLMTKYPEYADQIDLTRVIRQYEPFENKKTKYINTILYNCQRISFDFSNSPKFNKFPLLLGGDHSLAMGSIKASLGSYPNLGVVWIDAHGDFNTPSITESGNVHGMPLAAVCGLGGETFSQLTPSIKLKKTNVVLWATRDIDDKEQLLIDKHNITNYTADKLSVNYKKHVDEMITNLKTHTNDVHISLDLDSLDPKVAPGVSTAVKGGLSKANLMYLLDSLFENFNITSMDIVEFNPENDQNDLTLKLLVELIEYVKEKASQQ